MRKTHCKECQQEISIKAESCPKCGAETSLRIYRRKKLNARLQWGGLAVFGFIMALFLAYAGSLGGEFFFRAASLVGLFGAISAWGSGKKPEDISEDET